MGLRGKTVLYLGLLIFLSLTILGVSIYWQGQKIAEKSALDLINKEMAEKGHTLVKDINIARNVIILTGLVIMIFFVVFISWFVSRRLVLPILRLSDAAKRVEDGDLSVRLDEEGVRDEFRILYHHMNVTADFQQRAREKLEEEIAARSSELATINIRMQGLLDSAPDAVVSIRAEDRCIIVFSKGAEQMFGYRAEEVLGKNVHILMPEPYHSQHDTYVTNYLNTGTKKIIGCIRPVKAIKKSGEIFDIDISVGECDTPGGKFFHAVIRDISTRVEIEKERERFFKELESRLYQQAVVAKLGLYALADSDLADLMDKAVAQIADTLDVDYCKVLELLPDGKDLLLTAGVGWKEGYVGHAIVSANTDSQAGYTLFSNEPVIVEDLRTETRFSGPPLLEEYGVISGMSVIIHGQERPFGVLGVYTTKQRMFTKDGTNFLQAIANILAAAIERKSAEEQLKQRGSEIMSKNLELEQANRHKSDFLTNMSHELRTPLTAIIGFSELLKDGLVGELTSKQKEYLTDIFTSGHHLLSLINEILDLSKIEAGAVALNLEKMNIPLLLESSFVMVQEKTLAHNITLDLKVEGIDQAYVDERKFKQIVYNLLSNAVEFTPDGGKVGIICRPEDEYIYLEIWDTGIGISEKDIKKLFRPFSQLDYSPARKHEGTGLGLAIVKNLVELHGGYVEVKSEAGKGSRFIVRLPYRKEVVGG